MLEAGSPEVEGYHTCQGVESGLATGPTHPVPPCFMDLTDNAENYN